MNSMGCNCITWDMDKIIYTCSAEHIGLVFPKRKWWNYTKQPREVRFEFAEKFAGEDVGIFVRILENWVTQESDLQISPKGTDKKAEGNKSGLETECDIKIPGAFREEIWKEFINCTVKKRRYDTVLIVDPVGNSFSDILKKYVEDVNCLAILTTNSDGYENVLEELEQEYGLVGMIFIQYMDFVKYLRQFVKDKQVLVFVGENEASADYDAERMFFRFPKNSLVLDFSTGFSERKIYRRKRMENAYVSMGNFLDNIVKNRYNSVVNEGLQIKRERKLNLQQNVSRTDDKNKLGGKRKGIRKWKKRRIS